MKLNGWQRLGLIAFLIWALVAFVGFWIEIHRDAYSHYDYCSRIYEVWVDNDDPDRGKKFQTCLKEAAEYLQSNWKTATNVFFRYVAFVIAIPALLVWGLISLIIVMVRWIRRGFAKQT